MTLAQFEACKNVQPDGCIVFIGGSNSGRSGKYRRIYFQKKFWQAHVLAYFLVNGTITQGLVINHLCNRPDCVNVQHLEAVTQKINVRKSRTTRLSEQDIKDIRAAHKAGRKQRYIAMSYGLTQSAISRICTLSNWSDIC